MTSISRHIGTSRLSAQTKTAYLQVSGQSREPAALMGIPISIPAVAAAPLRSSAAMRVMTSAGTESTGSVREQRGLLFHGGGVWV